MSGSAVELVVTPLGEVKEVKGFAELFADLLKDNPIAVQFVGGGSNEAAKPGDFWEVPFEIDLPKLGKFKGKRVYRYEGPDKVGDRTTAKIDVATELAGDLDID